MADLIDVLFDMRPKYLLVDEIEHLKHEYQTALLSLMETWDFNSSHALESQTHTPKNGTKKLSEPLLSRFRVMYLNEYEFSQFYEIVCQKAGTRRA